MERTSPLLRYVAKITYPLMSSHTSLSRPGATSNTPSRSLSPPRRSLACWLRLFWAQPQRLPLRRPLTSRSMSARTWDSRLSTIWRKNSCRPTRRHANHLTVRWVRICGWMSAIMLFFALGQTRNSQPLRSQPLPTSPSPGSAPYAVASVWRALRVPRHPRPPLPMLQAFHRELLTLNTPFPLLSPHPRQRLTRPTSALGRATWSMSLRSGPRTRGQGRTWETS